MRLGERRVSALDWYPLKSDRSWRGLLGQLFFVPYQLVEDALTLLNEPPHVLLIPSLRGLSRSRFTKSSRASLSFIFSGVIPRRSLRRRTLTTPLPYQMIPRDGKTKQGTGAVARSQRGMYISQGLHSQRALDALLLDGARDGVRGEDIAR